MNPPFTRQQDIDHVLHAWSLLNEGGILVSIVSESCFFRSNNKAIDFRTFLDEHQLQVLDLDSGDFRVSGTMVKTRIIVLKK
jgi:16S rRNA G1207 methylase RsmC